MNTESLITTIRGIISTGANIPLNRVFSPDLDLDVNEACAIRVVAGDTTNNLCNALEYSTFTFGCLIRGTENDTETRRLVDKIFNALHLVKDNGNLVNILCQTPTFVYRDENGNNLYNITFTSIVKGE